MRPRVKVDGEKLTCYPRFGAKTEIRVSDITARVVAPLHSQTALSSGISYPKTLPAGIRVMGNRIRFNPLQAALHADTPNGMGSGGRLNSAGSASVIESICYRADDKDIVTIHTGMKNALILDGFVCAHMNRSASD